MAVVRVLTGPAMTPRILIAAGFAVCLLLVVVVDLAYRRADRRDATLTAVLTAAMRTLPGRLLVLAAWLWIGWHFLAR